MSVEDELDAALSPFLVALLELSDEAARGYAGGRLLRVALELLGPGAFREAAAMLLETHQPPQE